MKSMIGKIALIVAQAQVVLGISANAHAEDDVAKQFVGMWRLASWPQRLTDGTSRQNRQSVGYLIYTDTHHMCFVGMDPNRPKWNSRVPTEAEAKSAITGLGAYCAAVQIHPKEGFILHQVDIDKNPNAVGRVRKRWFTFDGPNRLTLRVDSREVNPPVAENTLIWERVTK